MYISNSTLLHCDVGSEPICMRVVCTYVCVRACVCMVDELGVNSVPSTVSPCSTHCLPIVFHCHCMQSPDVECVHLTQPFRM